MTTEETAVEFTKKQNSGRALGEAFMAQAMMVCACVCACVCVCVYVSVCVNLTSLVGCQVRGSR